MQRMSFNGINLFFAEEEQDTVELIRQTCVKSMLLMQEHWGLDTPKDCRVYIMTSWFGFVLRSAPWPWKVLLYVTIPLWALQAKKIWPLAGGWEQRYGKRRAVGVKPPRLLQYADRGIGDRIFIRYENVVEKVQSITCHELTHAFTSHLQLPTWLKEGLSMINVDRFFEEPTVRYETLEVLQHSSDKYLPGGHQKLRFGDEEALVYLYARGYWLTRYIEETRPGLLKNLLSQRCPQDKLEGKIATAYGKSLEEFRCEIIGALVSYFYQKKETA